MALDAHTDTKRYAILTEWRLTSHNMHYQRFTKPQVGRYFNLYTFCCVTMSYILKGGSHVWRNDDN